MKENKNEKVCYLWYKTLYLKAFCLISSFIGRKQGVAIVEEYDKNFFLSFYIHEMSLNIASFGRIWSFIKWSDWWGL
jgi:hypothetical protein